MRYISLNILCPALELVHGAVEAKDRRQVHETLGGQNGFEGDEESTPPRQQQDLLVGSDSQNSLIGNIFWLQNWDDFGLDTREHAGIDVVRADSCCLDVFGVSSDIHFNPDVKKIDLVNAITKYLKELLQNQAK
jgi:hypothetical protein